MNASSTTSEKEEDVWQPSLPTCEPCIPQKDCIVSGVQPQTIFKRGIEVVSPALSAFAAPLAVKSAFVSNAGAGLQNLMNYPAEELVRLLVDNILLCREGGYKSYEAQEPGCLDSLIDGWGKVVKELRKLAPGDMPLISVELLSKLHSEVVKHAPEVYQSGIIVEGPHRLYPAIGHDRQQVVYCSEKGLAEAAQYYEERFNVNFAEICPNPKIKYCFALEVRTENSYAHLFLPFGLLQTLYKARSDQKNLTEILAGYFSNAPDELGTSIEEFIQQVSGFIKTEQLEYSTAEDSSCSLQQITPSSPDVSSGSSQAIDIAVEVLAEFLAGRLNDNFARTVRWCTLPGTVLRSETEYELQSLRQKLASCRNEAGFLETLATAIDHLQKIHPFRSGNGRTLTLFMQYILMAYGYPPATFHDPNEIYLRTADEEAKTLKTAIDASRWLIHSQNRAGHVHFYGYTSGNHDQALGRRFRNKLELAAGLVSQQPLEQAIACTDSSRIF